MTKGPKPRPPLERFAGMTKRTDTCWHWTGGTYRSRYGQFRPGGAKSGKVGAHLFALRSAQLPHNEGDIATHGCDNKLCVRVHPDHVRWGTHKSNAREREDRGRSKPKSGADNPAAKLTAEQVTRIREQLAAKRRHKDIAAEFRIARSTVGAIGQGKIWSI